MVSIPRVQGVHYKPIPIMEANEAVLVDCKFLFRGRKSTRDALIMGRPGYIERSAIALALITNLVVVRYMQGYTGMNL